MHPRLLSGTQGRGYVQALGEKLRAGLFEGVEPVSLQFGARDRLGGRVKQLRMPEVSKENNDKLSEKNRGEYQVSTT